MTTDPIEEWMRDHDYLYVEDVGNGEPGWVDLDDRPVLPEDVIESC